MFYCTDHELRDSATTSWLNDFFIWNPKGVDGNQTEMTNQAIYIQKYLFDELCTFTYGKVTTKLHLMSQCFKNQQALASNDQIDLKLLMTHICTGLDEHLHVF